MELHKELRAFYIKLPRSCKTITRDVINKLWDISKKLAIVAIDTTKNNEVIIHSEIEFSSENWGDAISYLRLAIGILNTKSGFLMMRKIIASRNSLKTEVQGYKITKRGVYNAESPESPDFMEDIIRLSGRNKRLQQINVMGKLFKFIQEQQIDDTESKG